MEEYGKSEVECKILESTNSNDKKCLLYVYDNYGHLLRKQNRIEDALENYKKAVLLAPDIVWPHANLAYLYYLKGQYEKALAEFRAALTLDPQSEVADKQLKEIEKKTAMKRFD